MPTRSIARHARAREPALDQRGISFNQGGSTTRSERGSLCSCAIRTWSLASLTTVPADDQFTVSPASSTTPLPLAVEVAALDGTGPATT
jgi:hypothetical protein